MNSFMNSIMKLLPDELFIKIKYFYHFKKMPNLKHPSTFNEKIQWLKLHDRKNIYSKMVDKHEAKQIIASIVGEEYVIPSYGVWDKFDDIDFDLLPDCFVLKTTHDCGGVIICRDKNTFDKNEARKFLNKHLKFQYFYEGREWPYKNVPPRIIAEAYMENSSTKDLKDYKFFTFDGKAKVLFIASERQNENEETKFDFYDMEFNHLPIKNGHPNSEKEFEIPENFSLMKELAEKLSKDIPHLRVDFYEVNGKVYVGELTFSHYSGFVPFDPPKWDMIFGDWIDLGI